MDVNYLGSNGLSDRPAPVYLTLEQSYNLVMERARLLVNQLIEDRGHDKPPFLPGEFGRLQGIKKIVKSDLGEVSGVLLRSHDGHVIQVNQNHHPVRQNFSCAHEIGHNLLRELRIELNTESIEYRTFNTQVRGRAVVKARERLCDAIATELLMPESVFGKYLSGFGLSVHSIERLAAIFRVSAQASAIRIAEISMEPCIGLLWRPWRKIRSQVLRLAWRVGPGIQWRGKANYMPVHNIVKHTERLYRAYEDDAPVRSSKVFKLGTITKVCPLESKGFGRDENRYVLSLAFPDR